MKIEFLSAAEQELIETIVYYNLQSEGLGYEFASEVKITLTRILAFPEAWILISKRTRRCRTKRFPYGILYQIRNDIIQVVAVQNLHRHPDSWKIRLTKNQL